MLSRPTSESAHLTFLDFKFTLRKFSVDLVEASAAEQFVVMSKKAQGLGGLVLCEDVFELIVRRRLAAIRFPYTRTL